MAQSASLTCFPLVPQVNDTTPFFNQSWRGDCVGGFFKSGKVAKVSILGFHGWMYIYIFIMLLIQYSVLSGKSKVRILEDRFRISFCVGYTI